MRRHIIGSLGGMGVMRVVLKDMSIKPPLQVTFG